MIIEWDHIAVEVITVTAPIVLFMWKNRNQAKAEVEKRHLQNQSIIEDLLEERKYFVPHEHLERSGTLTYDGIRRRPNGRL